MNGLPARYIPVSEEGRLSGGRGEVFRVLDRVDGRYKALKLAHREVDDEEYGREYVRLLTLSHPAFPEVFEFGRIGEPSRPFYTMEWIDGLSVDKAVISGEMTLTQILRTVSVLSEILAFLHRNGLVYLDLKPDHVRIERKSTDVRVEDDNCKQSIGVRLLDLGLALDISKGSGRAGGISGTFPYIAPELLQGRKVDGRADVFSLGVLLLQLLTGDIPFLDSSIEDTAKRILGEDPVPPDMISLLEKKGCPADTGGRLKNLLGSMLVKEPSQRIADEFAIRDELNSITDSLEPDGNESSVFLLPAFPFTAREKEMEVFLRASMEAGGPNGGGRCVTVMVTGVKGAGKSRFLEEAAGRLAVEGRFTTIRMRSAGRGKTGEQTWGMEDSPTTAASSFISVEASAALILSSVPESTPVALILDPFPLTDENKRFLTALESVLENRSSLLAVAVSEDDESGNSGVESFHPDHLIRIEPFTEEETASFLKKTFGSLVAEKTVMNTVTSVSGGLPGIIVFYVEWLLGKGLIIRNATTGVCEVDKERLAGSIPSSLIELAEARLETVGPDATTLLEYLACADGPIPESIVAHVLHEKQRTVSEPEAVGLVEQTKDGMLVLADEVVGRVLLSRMDNVRKSRLHAALGEVLIDSSPSGVLTETMIHERAALHFEKAGIHTRARRSALKAARLILNSTHLAGEAVPHLELALRNIDPDSETELYERVSAALASSYMEDGRFQEAFRLLDELLNRETTETAADFDSGLAADWSEKEISGNVELFPPPVPAVPALRRLAASALAQTGDVKGALKLLETNSGDLTLAPEERILSVLTVMRLYETIGEFGKALDAGNGIRGLVLSSGNKKFLAELDSITGSILSATGDLVRAKKLHLCALVIRLRNGTSLDVAKSWNNLAILSFTEGNFKRAVRCASKALRIRKKAGDKAGMAETLNNLGVIHSSSGREDRAVGFFEQSLAIMKGSGDLHGSAALMNNLALLRARRGELDKALELYRNSEMLRRRIGDRIGLSQTLNNRGLIHVRLEEWKEAALAYGESLKLKRRERDLKGEGNTLGNLGVVHYHLGNWDEAEKLLSEGLELAVKTGNSILAANAKEALGMLLLGRGRFGDAFSLLNEALDFRRKRGDAGPLSDTLVILSTLHLESGRSEEAEGLAVEAVELVSKLDDPHRTSVSLVTLAESRLATGDTSGAFEAANRAALQASGMRNDLVSGIVLRLEGKLARRKGDFPKAINRLDRSLTFLERHGYVFEKAKSLFEKGLAELEAGLTTGRKLLEEAGEIFSGLGAVSWMGRVTMELNRSLPMVSHALKPDILYRIAGLFSSGADIDGILSEALDIMLAEVNAERGIIFLLDGSGGDFEMKAHRNMDRETISDAKNISRNIINRVYREDEVLFSANAQADERFSKFKSVVEHRILSFMCVPVRSGGRILGTIYLDNRSFLTPFRPSDAGLLKAFAAIAGIAIENASLRETIRRRNTLLQKEVEGKYSFGNIIGNSAEMRRIFSIIEKVTDLGTTVLVEGETGTGKELIARAIHYNGARKKYPFVAVDCGLLHENLMESELFGHVKGAFSGAVSDKKGLVELADHGTLFLDEITNLSHALQAKLLRVLQEGEYRPLGSGTVKKTDARLVCATNRNLETMVEKGEFREDLYYRINVVSIRIPPLRERKDDIPLMVEHFVRRKAEASGREIKGVTREVMDAFVKYQWPGNVREMEHTLERMVIMSTGPVLGVDLVPARILNSIGSEMPMLERGHISDLRTMEKKMILAALEKEDWFQTRAARLLGITERNLRYKMKKYNINNVKRGRKYRSGERNSTGRGGGK